MRKQHKPVVIRPYDKKRTSKRKGKPASLLWVAFMCGVMFFCGMSGYTGMKAEIAEAGVVSKQVAESQRVEGFIQEDYLTTMAQAIELKPNAFKKGK